jgi:hypothetical protein
LRNSTKQKEVEQAVGDIYSSVLPPYRVVNIPKDRSPNLVLLSNIPKTAQDVAKAIAMKGSLSPKGCNDKSAENTQRVIGETNHKRGQHQRIDIKKDQYVTS